MAICLHNAAFVGELIKLSASRKSGLKSCSGHFFTVDSIMYPQTLDEPEFITYGLKSDSSAFNCNMADMSLIFDIID